MNRTAIITGASAGLGKAIATELSLQGYNLVIGARNKKNLSKTVGDLANSGEGTVISVAGDATSRVTIKALVDVCVDNFGGIDVVITNTGGPKLARIEELDNTDWQTAFESLFQSVSGLVSESLPYLKKSSVGRIINISSATAFAAKPKMGLSNAIRAAVHAYLKTLSLELDDCPNLTVNSVCPSLIATRRQTTLTESLSKAKGIPFDEAEQMRLSGVPIGRFGNPSEVASLVAFLASKKSSYINGNSIRIDGGSTTTL